MGTAALPAARTWAATGPWTSRGYARTPSCWPTAAGGAAYGTEDLLVVDVPMDLSRRTRTEMNIVAAQQPELYGALVAPAQQ